MFGNISKLNEIEGKTPKKSKSKYFNEILLMLNIVLNRGKCKCITFLWTSKRCKTSIWSQNAASIQPRTSLIKFDQLAEKSEQNPISSLSTEGRTNRDSAVGATRRRRRAELPVVARRKPGLFNSLLFMTRRG